MRFIGGDEAVTFIVDGDDESVEMFYSAETEEEARAIIATAFQAGVEFHIGPDMTSVENGETMADIIFYPPQRILYATITHMVAVEHKA